MARDPAFVLRYLAEVEELAEDVLAARQQIVDLDVKRNRNREALRALHKDPEPDGKAMVCFGNMFVELPKSRTKEMMQKGTEAPIRLETGRAMLPCGAGFWRSPETLTEAGCCHRPAAIAPLPWARSQGAFWLKAARGSVPAGIRG
uniref:P53 and DNA damage regulated 1 n=1 Tax=Anser cygnoides TaxID=8845 RepID=A0A8B9EPU7_ANSCY